MRGGSINAFTTRGKTGIDARRPLDHMADWRSSLFLHSVTSQALRTGALSFLPAWAPSPASPAFRRISRGCSCRSSSLRRVRYSPALLSQQTGSRQGIRDPQRGGGSGGQGGPGGRGRPAPDAASLRAGRGALNRPHQAAVEIAKRSTTLFLNLPIIENAEVQESHCRR